MVAARIDATFNYQAGIYNTYPIMKGQKVGLGTAHGL